MNITLKPELEEFIQEKIRSGHYQTAEDVIIEAFRLLAERDRDYGQWVEETRTKVDAAIASLAQGDRLHGEEVTAQLLEKLQKGRENCHS